MHTLELEGIHSSILVKGWDCQDMSMIQLMSRAIRQHEKPRTQEIGCACIFGQLEKQAGEGGLQDVCLEDLNSQPTSRLEFFKFRHRAHVVFFCVCCFYVQLGIFHKHFEYSGLNAN